MLECFICFILILKEDETGVSNENRRECDARIERVNWVQAAHSAWTILVMIKSCDNGVRI